MQVSQSRHIRREHGAMTISHVESMKAVEQNSDLLNEIAEAARTIPGDARDAWQVIGARLAAGHDLPTWVKEYLRDSAANVACLDNLEGTASAFGFYPDSDDAQTKPKKALWDSLTVFSVIAGWRREAHNAGHKLSLEACFKRYILERLNDRDHEETVKTAYYRGRAIAEAEIGLLDALAARGA